MARYTSRERLLTAISHAEADHVPFMMMFLDPVLPPHMRFSDQLDRTDRLLALGLDDTLSLDVPWRIHPDVRMRSWRQEGERYPLIYKIYETPRGALEQVVRQTEDWPHGDDAPVFSDFNIPRSKRFLVETEADLECLPYILCGPSAEQVRGFREQAAQTRKEARARGVAVAGHWITGGDAAMWLCGAENFMVACKERPGFAREVLAVIHEWEIRRLEILLETGVCDIAVRRGWYECTSFFSPAAFREWILPQIREEAEMAHRAGARYQYILTTGIMDLIPELLESGIDILWGVDPVEGVVDLPRLKRECGDRICFVGGVNSFVTLGRGSREKIRRAVKEAIESLAPGGGFVLLPVDSIDRSVPWQKAEWMIEAWREWGGYPLVMP
ncbi:MAG: hypothetical protein IT210_11590 [Armatimonadetes bacterium]|nr:hypothetical protein [Armatimonadota bacterium]